jgi:hypothetical protein
MCEHPGEAGMHYYVWVLCPGPTPLNDADVECILHSVLAR